MDIAQTGLVAALAATAVSLAGAVYYEVVGKSAGAPDAGLAQVREEEEARDRDALRGIQRLPLTILYATTTGTSKRYAEALQREVFALNVGGFHFDTRVIDLASYNAEHLEDESTVVMLIPTWTGGVPAATAVPFVSFLRDLSTDFRVSKTAYSKLRYALFGLGNSEYDEHWCRAAIDVDEALQSLSGEALLPVCKGDDGRDQDGTFASWTSSLIPALCELYAKECGEAEESGEQGGQQAPGGCGTCGSSAPPSLRQARSGSEGEGEGCGAEGCTCSGGAGARADGAEGTSKEWLSKADWRRQKKRLAEEAEKQRVREAARAAAAAAAVRAAAAGVAGVALALSSNAESGIEYTEEDEINDKLLAESDARLSAEEAHAVAEFVDSDDEEEEGEEGGVGVNSKAGAGKARAVRASSMDAEGGGLVDLEDIGTVMARASEERKKEEDDFLGGAGAREMVTPAQRKALTKEGYKIIGSHSAVKLCRWTKAQLRGRGGCYKHTLYGIQSYQCMEATPSLACANKCTFCWRHHKNPVGRNWRWKVDDPLMIVEQAVAKHVGMIKEFKGTPGVLPDRWADAHTVRHCALSLVGEPIMYPHINTLIKELHRRQISTFLVTNAQFPEAIANLQPVTQLYVSVDAATKDVLRAVDRPLFADFWERFLASLAALKHKGQRTVYRMTLVKGQNCGTPEDVRNYAELIAVGEPDLIEIKGVTWCGVSEGSDLTMANVPWHEEVRGFAQQLAAAAGAGYELAAEHAHSCCVLLAKTKFKVGGVWHTHIDYARFHALMAVYYASGGAESFTSLDYMAPTPAWAHFGAPEAGFDPIETRWRRNKGGEGLTEINYQASESGCG